ncbi:DUF2306 domain-containing protein [Phenylobacterium sp.]|jgi:uncharacterized membrane protein|uniref:DUF2306 domain-containing protein n=1 Tax=Phenylobacterium sp. TaxID=1871053 RepID=UPI002F3F6720
MNSKVSGALWALMAFLSLGIAIGSFRYLLPNTPGIPPGVAGNVMRHPWLVLHAGLAATALIVGPFQFIPRLRAARPRLHHWVGRIYVVACLLGGPAGLLLAWGTSAGPVAQFGFGLLAISWIFCTAQAWRLAMARRIVEHRRWMVRSFALTLAAVTLRLYLPIPPLLGIDFVEGYRAISWLCWIPNLLAAELYLNRARLWKPATLAT